MVNVALVPVLSQMAEQSHGRKYGATYGLASFVKKTSGGLLGMLAAAWMVENFGFTTSLVTFGAGLALSAAAPVLFSRHVRLRVKEEEEEEEDDGGGGGGLWSLSG